MNKTRIASTILRQILRYIIISLIILIEGIIIFCLTPPANYGEWAVKVGVIIQSIVALCISVILAIMLNLKGGLTILKNILLCFMPYSQIIYCGIFYKYGILTIMLLPVFQCLFCYLVWKFGMTTRNKLVLLSNLLFSSLWAISLAGHKYYWYISHDLETVGVVTAEKIIAVIFIILLSLVVLNQKVFTLQSTGGMSGR